MAYHASQLKVSFELYLQTCLGESKQVISFEIPSHYENLEF